VTEVSVGGRAPGLSTAAVRRAVGRVLEGEQKHPVISITFLGPVAMRRMNRRHRKHDRPTDVLSFALALPDGRLAGDIYICRAEALANARVAGVPVREELLRLVVHGVLHVLGYDHPEGGRAHSAMWRRQEKYVRQIFGR
jgi:probable rRNA maturation factor